MGNGSLGRNAAPPVAVIVPARNAEATLGRTLHSIRSQDHAKLEIVVVDDGSTDGTAALVRRHAGHDPRIRLVTSDARGGVAAARNRGAREASADYLAFLDADDVMAPDAISSRLSALLEMGAGMAWCWSAVIDEQDRVRDILVAPELSGAIFDQLVHGNFIGNGSAVLCTREAFEAVGGFSAELFRQGAQGCEDHLFYLEVARRYPVACTPRFLIGYRQSPGAMSDNPARMLRSMKLMHAQLLQADPDCAPMLAAAERELRLYFAMRAIRAGKPAEAWKLLPSWRSRLAIPGHALLRRLQKATRAPASPPAGRGFPYNTMPAP